MAKKTAPMDQLIAKAEATKAQKLAAKRERDAAKKREKRRVAAAGKMTREQWLMRLTRDHFSDLFAKVGRTIPAKLRISCGWPSSRPLASGKTGRVLGQCWYPAASADGATEIFVSPCLDKIEDVGGTLAHELVHAVLGEKDKNGEPFGHGAVFKEVATGIGLEGKMTATVPSQWLKDWLAKAAAEIGPYPHAKLDMSARKKQSTRLLKVVCVNPECDFFQEEEKPYTVRMSLTVFDAGKPCCGVCQERMEVWEEGGKGKAAEGEGEMDVDG